ncbi:chemotaxis protein CheB [Bosea sp. 685]|uniref:chemotaxis protein CheB n=1 Tax=Bosea sp. 685 TaxID=3080057 RepID=UPI002893706C|nr:chemotaxis protein CheB [Bosea sp. 685]WNJ89813.1 chemotaxis protein CheB [Bosea sp. 685]
MTQQSRSDTIEAARKAASLRSSEPGASKLSPDGHGLVVGIGASAGGLNAFKAFLTSMPAESGMTFVLIQHLAPDHKSVLTDLLGRTTGMPVLEAEDGVIAAANTVYVIPPNATLILRDRRLRVSKPAPPRALRRPIDTFFTSLAEDQGENAVCIVLSGTGSDGALGLSAVKENGGLTLAQAESDHIAMSGMPQSATATGFVDEVMPVEQMPARLLDHQRHSLWSRRARTVMARGATRPDIWSRSAPCCAPRSAMTSSITRKRPWSAASSAACRCCRSMRSRPISPACTTIRPRSICSSANS